MAQTHFFLLTSFFRFLAQLGKQQPARTNTMAVPSISTNLVWPLIVALPLYMTLGSNRYEAIFPGDWYDTAPRDVRNGWPSPLGLSLGLLAVAVGQIFVLIYFSLRRAGDLGELTAIQKEGPRPYNLKEGLTTHLAQPEGFIMLGAYLSVYWMLDLMPGSYYSFSGGINWLHVFAQLLITDFLQFVAHVLEHKVSAAFYRISHKPHHRFTNPRLFDAFDGSPADTICMILIPLLLTSRVVPANVWSYMTFGSLYANWLVLVHAEYTHVWDGVFRAVGFGTAGDHHVHHKLFVFNFGHLFM